MATIIKQLGMNTDSSDTLRTTKTLRERGAIVGRCFINIIKCFRSCKSKKKPDPQ